MTRERVSIKGQPPGSTMSRQHALLGSGLQVDCLDIWRRSILRSRRFAEKTNPLTLPSIIMGLG
jgi:hypothetical protein